MNFPSDHDPVDPYDIDEAVFWPGVIILILGFISLIVCFVVMCKMIFFELPIWPWSILFILEGAWIMVAVEGLSQITKRREK